jgi:cell division protein FtsB
MPRRAAPVPPDTSAPEPATPPDDPSDGGAGSAPPPTEQSPSADDLLAALPIAGVTRRRVALIAGAIVSIWVVAVIVRQVGDASAATARVEATRESNAQLAANVEALERELELIQRDAFVAQQARSYGLGGRREIPFSLSADVPPLPPNAPGSASERLGSTERDQSPLESWLELLFGPPS